LLMHISLVIFGSEKEYPVSARAGPSTAQPAATQLPEGVELGQLLVAMGSGAAPAEVVCWRRT
jgi:hypothetical protein